MPLPSIPWQPPSDLLEDRQGVWHPKSISAVSYPVDGNDLCFQLEDSSWWFAHRNACLLEMVRQFPPSGQLYDIGGGNGFVAAALQQAGHQVALVEPGPGALNARRRGVQDVVRSTLADAGFHQGSLPAAGAFDVVEHIADDSAFLSSVRQLLQPGGRFYCTVPAWNPLWSDDDVRAGHFRRYGRQSLTEVLQKAGFGVEFMTGLFSWLTLPVLLLRTLPSRLKVSKVLSPGTAITIHSDHRLPRALTGMVRAIHHWELSQLKRTKSLPVGTSLLCVARALA